MAKNNFVFLRGAVVRGLHFNRVPAAKRGNGRTAFLQFYLKVPRGPSQPQMFPTDSIRVVSYGKLAEHMYPRLEADSQVHVTGWLQYRANRKVLEVVANEIRPETQSIASRDVLEQLKQLAEQQGTSVSEVLEELLMPQLEALEQGDSPLALEGQTDHGD